MSLDDFFAGSTELTTAKAESLAKEKNRSSTAQDKGSPAKLEQLKKFTPSRFDVGQDLSNIFLLDVQYQGEKSLARCIFYHPDTKSIYYWDDTTGHKPYFLTPVSKKTILGIKEIARSKELLKIEEIEKFSPLDRKKVKLTKIYGTNPLAIGGRADSFREFVPIAYEAEIRYHFNYVADMGLTPGTYYNVKNGKLEAKQLGIDPEIKSQLEKEFEGENKHEIEMLNEYMPLLFQEIPDILRVAFDIEIGSEKNILPNPNNPKQPIISIATADSEGRKICWILNTEFVQQEGVFPGIDLRKFHDEYELLNDFFSEIDQYPMVLSFNGDHFDCPYLYNRADKLGFSKSEIPFIRKRNDYAMKNSVHIDLYKFFRQASIRLYAFGGKYDTSSLNDLANALLGAEKLDHPDVWINEMDLKMLVKYNVHDAELTVGLTSFNNNLVLNLIFILTRICKMPIYDFTRIAVSGWLQMWLIFEHRKRGYLIPRKIDILEAKGSTTTSQAIIDGKKFQGATVLDPKPGIWWDVTVLDFASLYPSIIKTRNLSYETIRCEHDVCKSNLVPEVGHWACTLEVGIFSILLGFVRDTRVKWFKPRSTDQTLSREDRETNQVIQSSLKVLINAGYGVFGSEAFDFYCPPVAESTTAYARHAIEETQKYVEGVLDVQVLYGDTDSVFLHKISAEQVDMLFTWGMKHIGVELGVDYEFRYVVFSNRKKNYFGITKRGGTVVKGLMGKKSNTPPIIRAHFTKLLEIMIEIQSPADFELAKDKIKHMLQDLVKRLENNDFDVEDAAIQMTISRRLKEYTTWTQTIQVVGQIFANDPTRIGTIDVGDTIKFLKVNKPISFLLPATTVLAFPKGLRTASVIPVELVKSDADLDGQPLIDFAQSTFSQLLETIGLSWDEVMGIQSLDDWF
ncbi:MAG: DNA-directed DNA polymerase I [Candidatus Heimdallarchaeota archaeon]|nr:DNA-directed DNA polymerase I [Candidatus Heimdallarchaeota archaeon]